MVLTEHGLPDNFSRLSDFQLDVVDKFKRYTQILAPWDPKILHLKTCWNATVPIACIPPELLSAVFIAYAQSVRADYIYSWREVQPYSWVRVSHVCGHWRDVALACSALWSWIVPASDMCMQAMLHRSRQVPLTINLNTQLSSRTRLLSDRGAIETIYHHWDRIGRAKIEVPHPALTNVSAPLLHTLDIRSWRCSDNAQEDELIFRAYGTPSLKRVSWSGGLRWDALAPLLGPNIEELQITPTFSTIPVEAWLVVLRNMPHLRILSLDGAVQTDRVKMLAYEPPTEPPISLPHLQNLTLSASACILGEASLLAHLAVSDKADIFLSTYFVPEVTGDEANILSASVAAATSNRRIQALSLWRQDHSFFRPRTTLRWVLSAPTAVEPAICGRISIELRVDFPEVERTTIDVSRGLPLSDVTSMHLALGDAETDAFGAKTLSAAFGNMTRLQKLIAEGKAASSIPDEYAAFLDK